MLECLQYYTSGFWVWAGITIALAYIVQVIALIILGIVKLLKRNSNEIRKNK